MALKRSAPDQETTAAKPHRHTPKRTKLAPNAEREINSSEPSTCSVSEDSIALHSSPPASEHTRKTSLSSLQSYRSDLPLSSESSMSSNESVADSDSERESGNEDGEEEIVTLGGPKKPAMRQRDWSGGAQDLRSRLEDLLPRLAASNEMLESEEGVGGSMEDVEEGQQHIEMNLGLGVLEEQNEDSEKSIKESSDKHENDVTDQQRSEDGDPNAMNELLGRSHTKAKAGIESLDDDGNS